MKPHLSKQLVKFYNQLHWRGVLCLLVIVFGLLVLIGWYFNIEILKRPLPGLVAMNPVTALCFITYSTSFLLLSRLDQHKTQRLVGLILIWIVMCIGMIKVSGSILNVETNIDSWLFSDRMAKDVVGNLSNELALNTAIGFVLTGISLLLLPASSRKHRVSWQYVILPVGIIGMLSVLGYLYQVDVFYGYLAHLPMAIHTAICFLLLTLALLFAYPNLGPISEFSRTTVGGILARTLLPTAIVVPFLFGLLSLYGEWKGFYSTELGTALFTLTIIIVFFILIWFTSRELNRKDMRRKKADVQLKSVNKELEAFSYSVAHDLRAPIRAINGYGQMLKEDYSDQLDTEGNRILETIRRNATKMGVLIDDLLAFSRLGRKDIQKRKIVMNTLVEGVIQDLDNSVDRANIKVGKLRNIYGDYNLIYQVIMNLLSNGIKYSSKREKPLVEISSEVDGSEVVFSVKDNGVGFNMEYAHKLFGVFERLHSDQEFEGTGVGLAIVHKIITKHNGRVWAKGEMDEGATFYFSIEKNDLL